MSEFFTPVANTKPYLKMAFHGLAGTGKTYTASQIAIGLHGELKSKKAVVIFDTEKAAKFLKEQFAAAGIQLLVREAKSLADLNETMQRCVQGASDILLIDSISHVWERFVEDYKESKKKTRLEMLDWGVIKPMWKRLFTDPFVQQPINVIMTGRSGYEYESEVNAETGKREIHKTGVKMKVEGETAYEPDVLVLMERFEEILTDKKRVWRQATVLKDRSTLIDGKTFENPTYEHFAPVIAAMLKDPTLPAAVSAETPMRFEFRSEEEKYELRRDRERWFEEIDGFLNRIFPGSTGKDRANKLEMLHTVFGTQSETAIRDLFPDKLKEGYRKVIDLAVELSLAHWAERDGQKVLRIGADPLKQPGKPHPAPETPAPASSAALNPPPKAAKRK